MPVLPPPLPPLASHCSLRQGRNIEFGMREDEHIRMCLTGGKETFQKGNTTNRLLEMFSKNRFTLSKGVPCRKSHCIES